MFVAAVLILLGLAVAFGLYGVWKEDLSALPRTPRPKPNPVEMSTTPPTSIQEELTMKVVFKYDRQKFEADLPAVPQLRDKVVIGGRQRQVNTTTFEANEATGEVVAVVSLVG